MKEWIELWSTSNGSMEAQLTRAGDEFELDMVEGSFDKNIPVTIKLSFEDILELREALDNEIRTRR